MARQGLNRLAVLLGVAALFSLPTTGEATTAPASTADDGASLPAVSSGARPGPDVLYSRPPAAPQLENRDPRFRASPILVMGQEAYVDGEYLYQDWLYDDNGSDTGASDAGGQETAGDVEYPTDRQRYGGNAADLVEVRIAPQADSVAYRFTLNTLLVPDSTIVTLAFDTDKSATTGQGVLPRDPRFWFPGTDEVITTWGTGAEHSRLPTVGDALTTAVGSHVDLEANQITVTVPRSISDPAGTWKATVAAGLFDATTGGWRFPVLGGATEASPGGAGPQDPVPSGVLNLGFRLNEAPVGINPHDAKQAVAIKNQAPGVFQREIDFGALARGENRTTVPPTGTMSRIFASRINFGEGKNYAATPELLGQLQPYSIYVPTKYETAKPVGLTINLHGANQHHYQYNQTIGVQQIGEHRDNVVIAPEARGADGWYLNDAEYDVFEAWNDAARHYSLDPDRVAIAGYSMGGYGAYRLATLYPDLFGRAFTIAGAPAAQQWAPPAGFSGNWNTHTNVWLENARNVPFLNAAAALDQFVPITGTRAQNLGAPELGIRGFDQLGYRYRFTVYPTAEHLTFGFLNYNLPYATEFLGDAAVDRNPYHVTFSYAPGADNPALGLVHDHAYWVSEVRLADVMAGSPIPKGTVDAFTHTAAKGVSPSIAGTSSGFGPLPYVEMNRSWGEAPAIPEENKLTLSLTNVGSVTLDTVRAGLDLERPVTIAIDSSHEGELVLAGDFGGHPTVTADGERVPVRFERGRLVVPVEDGKTMLVITSAGFRSNP